MKIIDLATKLAKSLTVEQRDDLLEMVDACRGLGATAKQMAPLYVVCFFGKSTNFTKEEEAYAKKLGKKYTDYFEKL